MALKRFNPDTNEESADKKAILYVEDNTTNWEITRAFLESDYDLKRAANSKEAFERVGANDFHLILMDIQLAGSDLDGIEITRILRGQAEQHVPTYAEGVAAAETPIIFLTAYSARYDKRELMGAGGDDLVNKPVDFAVLGSAIERLLNRQARGVDHPAREAEERRKFPRSQLNLECFIEGADSRLRGTTLDISPGGARIEFEHAVDGAPLVDADTLNIHIDTIWGGLKMPCRMSRKYEGSNKVVVVVFEGMSSEQEQLLEKWLFGES